MSMTIANIMAANGDGLKVARVVRPMYGIKLLPWRVILKLYRGW